MARPVVCREGRIGSGCVAEIFLDAENMRRRGRASGNVDVFTVQRKAPRRAIDGVREIGNRVDRIGDVDDLHAGAAPAHIREVAFDRDLLDSPNH